MVLSRKNELIIWVYDDVGVSQLSMHSALSTFSHRLSPQDCLRISKISSDEIKAGGLTGNGCFVMPGGADLPYGEKLNGRGNQIIRKFVENGNLYVGICAGGYYGARDITFTGKDYAVNGARELAFFPGNACGSLASLTNGMLYDETTASKAMTRIKFNDDSIADFYYHGGPHFASEESDSYRIIARYDNNQHAVVTGDVGKGKYLLSGVHFELQATCYNDYVLRNVDPSNLKRELALYDLIKSAFYGERVFQEIQKIIDELY